MYYSQYELTPTQYRIFHKLKDGLSHSREIIISTCLEDLATPANLATHISAIRKKLRPFGIGITLEIQGGRYFYRIMRYLEKPLE